MVEHLAGGILAAGSGERLRKGGPALPKPLVELGGQTLLARQARAMIDAGAHPVIAVVNSETARLMAGREMPAGLELCVRDTANSMETLFTIGEKLPPGRFILATVDAVLPPGEPARFLARAAEAADSSDGALGVVRWRGDRRPLFARIDRNGLITALGDEPSDHVTAGVYMLSTAIFRFADQARSAKLGAMREFLGYLVGNGVRLSAIELSGAIDIDEPTDLEAALAMVAAGRGQ